MRSSQNIEQAHGRDPKSPNLVDVRALPGPHILRAPGDHKYISINIENRHHVDNRILSHLRHQALIGIGNDSKTMH